MKKTNRRYSSRLVVVCVLIFLVIVFSPQKLKDAFVGVTSKLHANSAIVIPHFDFAKDSRQKFISQVSAQIKPDKIIILSTNHFNTGSGNIISSNQNWQNNQDLLKAEKDIEADLEAAKIVNANHDLVVADHGIRNVIFDLGVKFPDAQYLPLLIKSGTPQAELDVLNNQIQIGCKTSSCLFVVSVDFSHYGPNSLAQIHDQFSLSALSSLDEVKIKKAETDSPEVLSMLTSFAKSNKLMKFKLSENSNSGEAQKNDQIETTSWVIGQYVAGEIIAQKSTTLVVAGDMMLDRMINHTFKSIGFEHIFDNLGNRVFWGSDVSVANLEGPISDQPIDDNIATDNLVFNFAPESINALKFLKLNTVSLANNHTSNAGSSGLKNTNEALDVNGISHFGMPNGLGEESIKRYDTDIPVSIIGINCLSWSNDYEETLNSLIHLEKNAGRFVIIYPHWGSEYLATHANNQTRLAHLWIDNGVDMIIGSHPHVVEDSEVYKGKLIVYSLGNFVFDQTFSAQTQQGLVLALTINEKQVSVSYLPIQSANYKPQFARNDLRSAILDAAMPQTGYLQKPRSDTITLTK